jgi:hypothetical protein
VTEPEHEPFSDGHACRLCGGEPKGRKSGLTTLELHTLDMACISVRSAFGWGSTYLVGTAQRGDGSYRDVDVRTILDDDEFDRLFGDGNGALWELVCLTVGYFLRAQTGLPVDYQIQRMTEANERYSDGFRNPIGTGRVYAGGGDATNFVANSVKEDRSA